MNNISPIAGRKRGCGSCGQSESHESMLYNGGMLRGGCSKSVSPKMLRVGNDLPQVLPAIGLYLAEFLAYERQMEKMAA
jgi:hypothetical protein